MKGKKALAFFIVLAMNLCYMPSMAFADLEPGTFQDMPQERGFLVDRSTTSSRG